MSEEVKSEGFKSCPFCGSTKVRMLDSDGSFCVRCDRCGAKGPCNFWNMQQSAIDWNRRTEVLPQKNAETTQNDTPAVAADTKETDVDFVQTPGVPELWRLLVNHKPIATVWNSPVGLNITWFDETQTLFTREGVLDFVNQRLYLEVK